MSLEKIKILERALERERKSRKQAEKILEHKSLELYEKTEELKASNAKLEELISQKTSELKGVFENIIDAYVMIDLSGQVLKMNDAAVDLLGYDVGQEQFNLMRLVYKADYAYTEKAFKALVRKGSYTNYEARIITKNKEIRQVHVNASIIYNKNGKAIAAQGIVRDITQEILNKEAFEEQKKQLDIIVDNSPLGIVLTTNGIILKTNASFRKLLGYTEEELLEKTITDITYNDDREKSIQEMGVIDRGQTDRFTINKRYLTKNNAILNARTTVNGIKDMNGRIKYQVAIVEDITVQLAMERQKDDLLKSLEKRNEELNEYAHMVSHDLKSPLRSIETLVSWLGEDHDEVLNNEGKSYLNMIRDKLENMDNLIDGILRYSNINQDVLINKKVDINEVISKIKETIHIPEHISVEVSSELPVINVDKIRILQVFQNLISNAITYNDKDKGVIKITCTDRKSEWLFAIEDNGKGIPKAYHKKIFKIFQSLGEDEKSTGIGLSIVKKIINKYGGEIWLESTPGKGTTFYFTLKK